MWQVTLRSSTTDFLRRAVHNCTSLKFFRLEWAGELFTSLSSLMLMSVCRSGDESDEDDEKQAAAAAAVRDDDDASSDQESLMDTL